MLNIKGLSLLLFLLGVACVNGPKETGLPHPDPENVDAGIHGSLDGGVTQGSWSANATLETVSSNTLGGVTYDSCAQLKASWQAPADGSAVRLELIDTTTSSGFPMIITDGREELTFVKLKSQTAYELRIALCADEDCSTYETQADSATAETAEEVWQFLGTGNTIADIVNIVGDSNAKAHAIVYGSDAPTDLAGRVQLYYGAMGGYGGSLSAALSAQVITTDETTLYGFTSYVGSSGVIEPDSDSTYISWIGTGQGIPLSSAMGGAIRLSFEARGADQTTRIMHLDSQDGYVGLDFNSGTDTYCATSVDYSSGGGCEPEIDIGTEGDTEHPNDKLSNVRQHKIGVRTLNDWRWDGDVNTFMVLTTGNIDGCSTVQFNHGYAVYDGSEWQVQYESSGCPKIFEGVQAMAPLHRGEDRFKIQFGNPLEDAGKEADSNLPYLGPKRLIYAEGRRSGDTESVDFEDWDAIEDARDITFLWPDGSVFDTTAEGYIDDFVLLTPTSSLDYQVQYIVITDGSVTPFTSVAVLRNY